MLEPQISDSRKARILTAVYQRKEYTHHRKEIQDSWKIDSCVDSICTSSVPGREKNRVQYICRQRLKSLDVDRC